MYVHLGNYWNQCLKWKDKPFQMYCTKYIFIKKSLYQSVLYQNVSLSKCLFIKVSLYQSVTLSKCHFIKVSLYQNVLYQNVNVSSSATLFHCRNSRHSDWSFEARRSVCFDRRKENVLRHWTLERTHRR